PSGNLYASTTTLYQSTESMTGRLASHLPGYSRTQNYYDLGFIASWETDLFGGLKKGAQAATAEAQAAEASQTGTRITVAAEAADAYMQIRGAQARLIFAKDQIATDEHLSNWCSSARMRASLLTANSLRPKPCCRKRRRQSHCSQSPSKHS